MTTDGASPQRSDGLGPGPPNGTRLHISVVGRGPRIVMAHGFTQTSELWNSLDRDLATDHEVVLVDMPGHAGSAQVDADLVEGARLLGEAGGSAVYLGYSMGARFCLHLALARPDLVRGLVLISGTAGIEDAAERATRRSEDDSLADELDPRSDGVTHGGTPTPDRIRVDTFVRRWIENPLFAGIPPSAQGIEARLGNTGRGLASSLRSAGTGTQRPRWKELHRLDMPVLVITGELDTKFTALGARMAIAIGDNAELAIIADAGHAPHLEVPGEVAAIMREWRLA